MTLIFNDGTLEATLFPDNWVYCRWIQNQHGRLQKKLIKDMNVIEATILKSRFFGWFTDSELGHSEFHKLLTKFGAMPREVVGEYLRFVKPIHKEGDLHVRTHSR